MDQSHSLAWLAATIGSHSSFSKKVSRRSILHSDLKSECNALEITKLPIRVIAYLLLGILRIFSDKTGFLLKDAILAQQIWKRFETQKRANLSTTSEPIKRSLNFDGLEKHNLLTDEAAIKKPRESNTETDDTRMHFQTDLPLEDSFSELPLDNQFEEDMTINFEHNNLPSDITVSDELEPLSGDMNTSYDQLNIHGTRTHEESFMSRRTSTNNDRELMFEQLDKILQTQIAEQPLMETQTLEEMIRRNTLDYTSAPQPPKTKNGYSQTLWLDQRHLGEADTRIERPWISLRKIFEHKKETTTKETIKTKPRSNALSQQWTKDDTIECESSNYWEDYVRLLSATVPSKRQLDQSSMVWSDFLGRYRKNIDPFLGFERLLNSLNIKIFDEKQALNYESERITGSPQGLDVELGRDNSIEEPRHENDSVHELNAVNDSIASQVDLDLSMGQNALPWAEKLPDEFSFEVDHQGNWTPIEASPITTNSGATSSVKSASSVRSSIHGASPSKANGDNKIIGTLHEEEEYFEEEHFQEPLAKSSDNLVLDSLDQEQRQFLAYVRKKCESGSCSFDTLTSEVTSGDVRVILAEAFQLVLELASKNVLKVDQKEFCSPIKIYLKASPSIEDPARRLSFT